MTRSTKAALVSVLGLVVGCGQSNQAVRPNDTSAEAQRQQAQKESAASERELRAANAPLPPPNLAASGGGNPLGYYHDLNVYDARNEHLARAQGETFRGLDQMAQLAARSVAARTHAGGLGIKPTNVFTNADGTKLCWEYLHTGVVTDKWPSTSSQKPAPGTKFTLPIMLMCEIRQGKLFKVREYFDLLTLLEPGTPHKLYS